MQKLVFAAALVVSSTAFTPSRAHAFLQTAEPPVGSTLRAPPTEVEITFTEGVEPGFSTIEVQDSQGHTMTNGGVHLVGGDTHLAVALKPLAAGSYNVMWHATAVDTHKTQGNYTFTVKP